MKRLHILILLHAVMLAVQGQPNIVLIMADDLGYGDLSCYGSELIHTPHLDQMAAEGIKFTDFHSNGPVCSPTRAALMTGKYQQRTGVEGVVTAARHRQVGLSLEETTLAEALQKLDYSCGIFGNKFKRITIKTGDYLMAASFTLRSRINSLYPQAYHCPVSPRMYFGHCPHIQ